MRFECLLPAFLQTRECAFVQAFESLDLSSEMKDEWQLCYREMGNKGVPVRSAAAAVCNFVTPGHQCGSKLENSDSGNIDSGTQFRHDAVVPFE